MHAYNAKESPIPATILPPSLVLSLSPMFDSRHFFPPEKISPSKDAETPVQSPIPISPSSSVGSTSPIRTLLHLNKEIINHQTIVICAIISLSTSTTTPAFD
nr:hypothetical protein [Tanacetum cinerariifolium]